MMLPDDSADMVARDLLEIGAVALSPDDPFTWTSGRLAPVYCDNRMTMRYPRVRGRIASAFEGAIRHLDWTCDVVVGTATAGIPHAAWLAARLESPMAYVRSAARGHGKRNKVEGNPPAGTSCVVIEDLISTGRSSIAVVESLREHGLTVSGVMSIFSYGLKVAEDLYAVADVPVHALCTFSRLVDTAERDERLETHEIDSLRAWYRDPEGWSSARREQDS